MSYVKACDHYQSRAGWESCRKKYTISPPVDFSLLVPPIGLTQSTSRRDDTILRGQLPGQRVKQRRGECRSGEATRQCPPRLPF